MRGRTVNYEPVTSADPGSGIAAGRIGMAQGFVVLGLIGVCATLSTGNDGLSTGGPWKALATSGTVERLAESGIDPAWSAVRRGDLLAASSVVRTSADGGVTLSGREGFLRVDARTRLRLPSPSFAGALQATQDTGTVVYEAGGRSGNALRVTTPGLALASSGALFGVTVDGGWTLLSVAHGIVEIRPEDADVSMDVHGGEAVRVRAVDGRVEVVERADRPADPDASPAKRRAAWKQHRRIRRIVARLDRELQAVERAGRGLVTEDQGPEP